MKALRMMGAIAAVALFAAGAVIVAGEISRHAGHPTTVPAIARVPRRPNAISSTPALVAALLRDRSNGVSSHLSNRAPSHRSNRAPSHRSRSVQVASVAVVAIDPKTGRMVMPSAEQMRRLTQMDQVRVSRSPEGLVETHYPNGMVSIDLQGRFQDYATVWIRPDGTKEFHCVTDTSADAMARAADAEAAGVTPEGTARRGAGAPKEER